MEHFSNGAFLEWSNSQIKHFSNGAIWGRHHQLDDSLVGRLTKLEGKYFVLLFFPMDLTVDSEEVLSFKASLESFEAEGCKVIINFVATQEMHRMLPR